MARNNERHVGAGCHVSSGGACETLRPRARVATGRAGRFAAVTLTCAALTSSAGAAGSQTAAPSKDEIMQAMAGYLGEALPRMSYLVADEDYRQKGIRVTGNVVERRLRSEVLVVSHPVAPAKWLTFRDVTALDDGPIVGSERVQLTKLFSGAEPDIVDLEDAHVHAEADEIQHIPGARYSLAMNPFDAMLLMQPLYWPRLEFTLGSRDATVGPDVWRLDFRERAGTAPNTTTKAS